MYFESVLLSFLLVKVLVLNSRYPYLTQFISLIEIRVTKQVGGDCFSKVQPLLMFIENGAKPLVETATGFCGFMIVRHM